MPHLEKDGCGADFLGVCLKPVAQMTAVGQIKAHDALMGVEECGVHLGIVVER